MGEDSTTMVDGSGSKKWPGGLRDRVSESKNDRIKEERSWDLALLFLSGNQWLTYDENLRQYELTRPRRGQQTRLSRQTFQYRLCGLGMPQSVRL